MNNKIEKKIISIYSERVNKKNKSDQSIKKLKNLRETCFQS